VRRSWCICLEERRGCLYRWRRNVFGLFNGKENTEYFKRKNKKKKKTKKEKKEEEEEASIG
jgi:hypothetical protein